MRFENMRQPVSGVRSLLRSLAGSFQKHGSLENNGRKKRIYHIKRAQDHDLVCSTVLVG
jgi:hypothetical protein